MTDAELLAEAVEIRNGLPDGHYAVKELDALRDEYYAAQARGRGSRGLLLLIRGWIIQHRWMVPLLSP